ncbi:MULTISPECIES: sucrase ferredoxin [Streptomyces]|uniref:Sucrase ferredoxin n=1 Tax=Streptomyces lonegramiae TaxID=3075524 RepID=A0ABU2XBW3_9ACTN|nr:sucrase ferredoxin [Streptomyces sp. DSM 41529]MDT0543409.1 sucrase ferredoxin [Streptomyces sp. DSM 41529]
MSTCATASRDLSEPLAGTATTATTWLLLEQPGPWGAEALTASHLAPAVGRALERAVKDTGVRVALIRRPGRHPDCHTHPRQRVFIAHTRPGRSWIRTTTLTEPERLLALDFGALGAGDPGGLRPVATGPGQAWEQYTGDPLVFVCTNGKRDRCCAILGRPLAAELIASGARGTWEITHIGGHRFSPTLMVLPHGYAYGRATAQSVQEVLDALREGRVVTEGCRGRSTWERPGQAAELAIRELTGEAGADALTVLRTEGAAPAWTVTVEHTDGRLWRVGVVQVAAAPPRPESCGSVLGSPARMDVVGVRAVRASRPVPPVAATAVTQPSIEEPPRRATTSARVAPV